MQNFLFQTIRKARLKRNKFNLSHDVKLSMKMGELIPILCQDVIPGDTFKLNTELLIRFAPLIAPVMHRINVYTHFFFVPKRLVWDNWKDFITGGESGTESPAYPRLTVSKPANTLNVPDFMTGSLADYLGFPVADVGVNGDNRFPKQTASTFYIDELPFRAYQLIYNEYYRDQNLIDEIDIHKDRDGISPYSGFNPLMQLRQRAWTKDYFTSSLPFAQRGEPVSLPLYGDPSIEVKNPTGNGAWSPALIPVNSAEETEMDVVTTLVKSKSGGVGTTGYLRNDSGYVTDASGNRVWLGGSTAVQMQDIANKLNVDMSNVSSATIAELRNAIKAQEFLEAQARGGSRYIEYILNIFGVRSSDARLQRPEYLGGGKQPVVVSDVMQTSETTSSSTLATPAGTAASLGKTHSFKRYFEEHGYVIGIMSVLPEPCYQQGMPKQFTKFDRFDHYLPQFARIGEQEVLSQELYFDPTQGGSNTQLFGYAPRYAEYKFVNSSVHGDFRTSLKYWHLGRIFANRPSLNYGFINSDPSERIFAVEDGATPEQKMLDKLWVSIHHNLVALRPMPLYGTPSIV